MPTSGTNMGFPGGGCTDLFFYNDTFTAANAHSGAFTGPAGSWGSAGAAGIFDVRQYESILITIACSAMTGTTPTLQLTILTFDNSDSSAQTGPNFVITQTVPSTGGVVKATFGVTPTTHVGMTDNFAMARTQERLMFFKIGIGGNGSTISTLTGPRLHVWGFR